MNEFNNRMEAQREVLNIINSSHKWREELCGLSINAIERWSRINQIEPNGPLTKLLTEISGKLFFLATKSQEQVTEEYRSLSTEVSKLTRDLQEIIG